MAAFNPLPEYVEIGARLYEVRLVPGPIMTRDGSRTLSRVLRRRQVVEMDASIPEAERDDVLTKVVTAATPLGWRQVPVVGIVS